jgi:hydrogenase maturation factor
VVLGPALGEDAAVIDLGTEYLVATTDPITFTAERLGWHAVNVNANDLATLGARPRWFLAALLLPEGRTTPARARGIFRETLRACRALGVTLAGGHTEVTARLDRPILVGLMLGEVKKSRLLRKDSQRPGDRVILTKGIAIEGTAILAKERARVLTKRLGAAAVRRARRLLFQISVLREAKLAAAHPGVRAMHDPTEGGLLAGLYELAHAGRVGLRITQEKIPVLEETRAFSGVLGFDPLALIASGALLVVASPRATPRLLRNFVRNGISASVIGEVRRESEGLEILDAGRRRPLRAPARDEIARLLQT